MIGRVAYEEGAVGWCYTEVRMVLGLGGEAVFGDTHESLCSGTATGDEAR